MPSVSLKVMQRFAIAIRNGADTVDKLMAVIGYKHNGIREAVRRLEKNCYAKRSYVKAVVSSRPKLIMVVTLTPQGLALANDAPVKLNRSGLRTPKRDEPSIMDMVNHTVYKGWLAEMKAIARYNTRNFDKLV